MKKKVKSISEFLTEDEILSLTEEAFTGRKVKEFKPKQIKVLATIAASVVLMIGVLNVETISAKTGALLSYVFGIGIQPSVDLNDYYTLTEAITLEDGNILEAMYRYDNVLKVMIKGEVNQEEIKVQVKGKTYTPSSITAVATAIVSDEQVPQIMQTELTFNRVPKVNEVELIIGDSMYTINLKQAIAHESDDFYIAGALTILPLTTLNDVLAIDYDIEQIGKFPWELWLHGSYFTDEEGQQYWVNHNSLNSYEVTAMESTRTQMVSLSGPGIIIQKNFSWYPKQFELPNPKDGETLVLDQIIDIDGIEISIHSISRVGDAITVTVSKDTSFLPLENIHMFAELSNSQIGNHDEDYFYETAENVVTDDETLKFTCGGLSFKIEQPYEINFK